MTPLSAQIYLEAYYELDHPDCSDLLKLTERFKEWTLIDVNALEDTWPGEGWYDSESNATIDADPSDRISKLTIIEQEGIPSLRARTLDQLVQSIIIGEETDPHTLSEVETLTDFYPMAKGKLYEQAKILESSPELLLLMFKCLEHDSYVDLSPFVNLTDVAILSLASQLAQNGCLTGLNLSGRPTAGKDFWQLPSHGCVERVYLMGSEQGRCNFTPYHNEQNDSS